MCMLVDLCLPVGVIFLVELRAESDIVLSFARNDSFLKTLHIVQMLHVMCYQGVIELVGGNLLFVTICCSVGVKVLEIHRNTREETPW